MSKKKDLKSNCKCKIPKKKKPPKNSEASEAFSDSDENFYFIAGYTPGGVPFGISWEEHENEINDNPCN